MDCRSIASQHSEMSSDESSGGAGSPSSASLALSPHPEEENIAPQGNINASNSKPNGADGLSSVGRKHNGAPMSPLGSAMKRRRLASPTASISYDGAHATPPSAIGGGLMPSPSKRKIRDAPSSPLKAPILASSQTSAAAKGKGKKKDTGAGEAWEEVLERLGSTASKHWLHFQSVSNSVADCRSRTYSCRGARMVKARTRAHSTEDPEDCLSADRYRRNLGGQVRACSTRLWHYRRRLFRPRPHPRLSALLLGRRSTWLH